MTREDLINQISEEINVGVEIGHEPEFIAKNIVALMEGSREHLDYHTPTHSYEWEDK
jgi:hypothetical protein